jgi:hypothetical protein
MGTVRRITPSDQHPRKYSARSNASIAVSKAREKKDHAHKAWAYAFSVASRQHAGPFAGIEILTDCLDILNELLLVQNLIQPLIRTDASPHQQLRPRSYRQRPLTTR